MRKRLFSLWVLALTLAAPATAQVVRATVEVEGMSCPFCAFGVEKRLRRVEGVGSVAVEMKEGRAVVEAADGASIDLAGLPEAVRKAGFTPGRLEIDAVGVLGRPGAGTDRAWTLIVAEKEEILLVEVSRELAGRLADLAAGDAPVRVRGRVRLPIEERPAVVPSAVEASP